MIDEKEKETIIECARKFGAKTVLLFGSAAEKDSGYNDIDLAVEVNFWSYEYKDLHDSGLKNITL